MKQSNYSVFVMLFLAFVFGWAIHSLFFNYSNSFLTGAAVVDVSIENNVLDDVELFGWTKAICDDNGFCVDVMIKCKNGKVVDLVPIKSVELPSGWEDPRSLDLQDKFC